MRHSGDLVPLKDSSGEMRKKAEDLKENMRTMAQDIIGTAPRPLLERKTILLREPILKTLSDRMKERRT